MSRSHGKSGGAINSPSPGTISSILFYLSRVLLSTQSYDPLKDYPDHRIYIKQLMVSPLLKGRQYAIFSILLMEPHADGTVILDYPFTHRKL